MRAVIFFLLILRATAAWPTEEGLRFYGNHPLIPVLFTFHCFCDKSDCRLSHFFQILIYRCQRNSHVFRNHSIIKTRYRNIRARVSDHGSPEPGRHSLFSHHYRKQSYQYPVLFSEDLRSDDQHEKKNHHIRFCFPLLRHHILNRYPAKPGNAVRLLHSATARW